MKAKLLDRDVLLTLSEWFGNVSAGWFGSIFILPLFLDTKPVLLLTVNLLASIMAFVVDVLLVKRARK